jgi:hypothetical protein
MIRPCSTVLPRLVRKPLTTQIGTARIHTDTISKPTSNGYLVTKDITPRPPYGPEVHPSYPILNLKDPHTSKEIAYLILGYTGHSKENADNIPQNGFTQRVMDNRTSF